MKLKIAQVIGLNTDQKAAQVISSERNGTTFLAVLRLTCDDAFTKGRSALSEMEDFYFESEGGAGEKLTATFKEFEKKFSAQDLSATDGPGSDWSLGLAAVSGKVLYLIARGQVEVYLKRKDKLSSLLSIGETSQLISGFLSDGDRLLLAMKSFITFLGEDLEKSLDLPIENFKEEIESKIGASKDHQCLAAAVADLTEEGMEISALPAEEDKETGSLLPQVDEETSGKLPVLAKITFGKVFNLFKNLKRFFPKSGRGRLIVAAVLLLVLAVGIGYKYKLNRDQKIQAQLNNLLQQAKDDFSAAKGLASLSPTEAKTKLDAAKNGLNGALALKPNNKEAQDLKNQIESESPSILLQSSVSDFPVFLDLELVKKNFRATQLSLSAGKLLVLDPGAKTLVVLDLAKKSNQILAGSEKLGEAVFASLNGNLAFVYSKDKGILKIDITNQKVSTVSKIDSEWGDIKDIYGFAGNVYLLDSGDPSTGSGQVWKYLPTSEGYSDKREYLSKGTKVDFAGALRMQIESSIYLLKSNGEMLRFTRGDKDNFSYQGLDQGVKDSKSFFVSSDTDDFYLLDSGNSRLLILTKTGSYKGQISGAKFGAATDLVVDEKGKKVYLLEGSKIYTADLK